MPDNNYLEDAKRAQATKLAQLVDALGWSLIDTTLPPDVRRYATERLSSLLEYLKARDQVE